MIVKILSSTRSFKGVQYNTDKVGNHKAELIKVANFGPLQALDCVRPEDYRNYLKMVSAQNQNTKKPQFHAVISTKGREHNKEELTEIAEKWLAKMGYSQQPYLLVFHKDTRNNHIHIVSSRIDKDGHKISSAFEKNRAIQSLNQVMGLDEAHRAKEDFEKALGYTFTSKTQFMMLLESRGYVVKSAKDNMQLIKFGKVLAEFDVGLVNLRLTGIKSNAENLDTKPRIHQLNAIFNKYLKTHDPRLYPVMQPLAGGREKALSVFSSDFAQFLHMKLGIELVFHSRYAYSILDHDAKNVFKGRQVIDLKTMLNHHVLTAVPENNNDRSQPASSISEFAQRIPAQSGQQPVGTLNVLLESERSDARYSGADVTHQSKFPKPGDHELGISPIVIPGDSITDAELPKEVLNTPTRIVHGDEDESFQEYEHQDEATINLADDIDDEAILGRNRRRQRKARTNTR